VKLNLYRRHRPECESGRPEDSRSTESEERRRGWGRKCLCPIQLSGTLAGRFSRKSTFTSDWSEAQRTAEAYEKADSWIGTTKPAPIAPELAPTRARCTVVDACKAFVSSREAAGLSPATLRKYRTFEKQIVAYAESRGYMLLDQFTREDVDRFWANWKMGARARAKRLTTLRGFFRFCVHRKWIEESPVSPDIKAPVGLSKAANKWPFTDAELKRVMKACEDVRVEWKTDTVERVWTGFRISDATFFNINRLHDDQVFIRAKTNGGDVFAYIPDWLRDRLLARAERYGEMPFITGRSQRLETVTNVWRRRIAKALDHARFVLDRQPHCLAAKLPDVSELSDPIVTLERRMCRWRC
jgi:site-specific recombinase XerC